MSENKSKLGQESAFPVVETEYNGIHQSFKNNCTEAGMSKRFYAACQIAPSVISSLLSNSDTRLALGKTMKNSGLSQEEVIVGMVYEYVDELLKQE